MAVEKFDVVVVGGGISGLAAARRLAGDGVERMAVLDAREEPGGRCLVRPVAGHLLDCGGAWTGPTQHHIRELASACGIETYSTRVEGAKRVRLVDGGPEYYDPDEPHLPSAAQAEVDRAMAEFDRLCKGVPGVRPWDAANASELDLVTVESWIRGQSSDRAVQVELARFFKTTAASLGQLSMLSLAAFVSSCGGRRAFESELDELFVGRAGRIARCLAEELGDHVRMRWPVMQISRSGDQVEVTGPVGAFKARRVIVAMSPADARRIQFRPGLSTKRELLHRAWFTASVIRMNFVYDRPFWREPAHDRPALAGVADNDAGGPHTVLDSTPADSRVGVLTAFSRLLGERERFNIAHDVLENPEARQRHVLENLVRMFGLEAAHPLAVQETHWYHEPYVSGCMGFAPPGLLTACGEALREPVGPIHWAGTEAAEVWIDHLSGAVQSGERAAQEVVAELATTR